MSSSAPAATSRYRVALPDGTLAVGVGLLITGIASYLFFKVGVHALGEQGFAPVSRLWFAAFALAPGCFLPLEQELGRALAHRHALGVGGAPVLRKVGLIGGGLAVLLVAAIAALNSVLADEYFAGDTLMVGALALSVAIYAPTHLTRGICAGTGRFTSYAVVLGADGLMRITCCAALAVVGVGVAGPYAVVVALAPAIGVIWVVGRGATRLADGPPATWSEVTPNLGWLLVGSIAAAALVNAGPIAAGILAAPAEEARITQFSYGVLVTRVPLFFFQAVQAALLPRLARLAAAGALDEFRRGLHQLLILVSGVAFLGAVGAAALGPWLVELVYGAELTRTTMALLAIGSGGYMIAVAVSQAVIALHGHAQVAMGWVLGAAAFVVVTAFSSDELFRRIELGLVASSVTAVLSFTVALAGRLR